MCWVVALDWALGFEGRIIGGRIVEFCLGGNPTGGRGKFAISVSCDCSRKRLMVFALQRVATIITTNIIIGEKNLC